MTDAPRDDWDVDDAVRDERRRRRARGWAAAALVAVAAAVGGAVAAIADREPERPARVTTVGAGPQTTWIFRPAGAREPLPAVLFLHGWGATLPSAYRPWIDHLVRQGNAVIYPRYQESVLTPPPQVLANLLTGVRLALRELRVAPRTLAVVGHSAGGALAGDYAAVARAADLPVPVAVMSAYPGRALRDIPARIPTVDPAFIEPGTHLLALAGADDAIVGTRAARDLIAGAVRVPRAQRRYELVRDTAVADHLGPARTDAASRTTFWGRFDALVRRARLSAR